MNIEFKKIVMAAQLIAAVFAATFTAFKSKESLHEYLLKGSPILAMQGDMQQSITGDGQKIVLTMPVLKTRECRLIDAGRLSASIYQESIGLNRFIFLEPVMRLRPVEAVQRKVVRFDIPGSYDISHEGLLSLDLLYTCKKGNESVYLDIPIRSLTSNERSHVLIMRQAREFNETGQWKKGNP